MRIQKDLWEAIKSQWAEAYEAKTKEHKKEKTTREAKQQDFASATDSTQAGSRFIKHKRRGGY